VTEMDTRLGSAEVAFDRLREMLRDVGPAKTEAVNQDQRTSTSVGAAVNESEIVGNLLEAAKMACGDLRDPGAIGPLRTLLSIIKALYETAPRLERDIRDLIEVASMACADLRPKDGRALRTLLRVAFREAEAQKGAAAVGLPGRAHDAPSTAE
jgi:hypothetical protein